MVPEEDSQDSPDDESENLQRDRVFSHKRQKARKRGKPCKAEYEGESCSTEHEYAISSSESDLSLSSKELDHQPQEHKALPKKQNGANSTQRRRVELVNKGEVTGSEENKEP